MQDGEQNSTLDPHPLSMCLRAQCMKKLSLVLLGLIAWFWIPQALAREVRVDLENDLHGAWLIPDKQWNGGVMLLLHGFADDMNGPADVTKRLAERLGDQGIATLRINFRGEGDRNRTDIRSTFATRIADTEARSNSSRFRKTSLARASVFPGMEPRWSDCTRSRGAPS